MTKESDNQVECNLWQTNFEEQKELALKLLVALNRSESTADIIKYILKIVKTSTGIEAVGIRLQDGEDFPYFETNGFPDIFVEKERSLCHQDKDGSILRDSNGNAVLECMCGNIICGRTNTKFSFFTHYGSFWSNCTSDLLANTTEDDRQARTRNRCNAEGYESVALIPIRDGDKTVGLLQLNDRRKNRFSVEMIRFFETIGASIGIAFNRKKKEEVIQRERREAEDALHKTQKLDSLGLLAGGIAHDFNNLMGGIFGYIDMASEASTEDKVTRYLSKAMNTIDRARGLTQQLLTFAKGGAPIQEIGQIFPFVEETAKFALSGANVSCHFDVPQELWACNFDKNQIGQVIDNLIINAQQAMPVGGTIELIARNITLAEKEHPLLVKGDYIKITVKDCGIGIPKEVIANIFDPFFTTKPKGHGLGLATCYSIINRHGGCIDVDSEPGKGSSFHVYLPASMESASSAKKKSVKTHKGSGTFLVMDDEEVMRDAIGDMLEDLGYSVIRKENGQDAIDFLASETKENRKIKGMIFDLTVPGGMGGKAAIEEIRKTNTEIPAFVASGYADDPVMKKPAEHGFTASICKPFRKVELMELLNNYLKPKK